MFSTGNHSRRRLACSATLVAVLALTGAVAWADRADPPTDWCQWGVHPQDPCVTLSPDGLIAASAGGAPDGTNSSIKLWDAETGDLIREIPLVGWPGSVAISSQGYVAAAIGSGLDIVVVFDLDTGEPMLTIHDLGSRVEQIIFSPDGSLLAIAEINALVKTYTIPEGALVRAYLYPSLPTPSEAIAFSPAGDMLASSGHLGCGPKISVFDFPGGELITEKDWTENSWPAMSDVDFSQDGTMLGVTASDGYLQIYDTSDWTMLHEFDAQDFGGLTSATEFAFSPDGRSVLWGVRSGTGSRATLALHLGFEYLLAAYTNCAYDDSPMFTPDGTHFLRGGFGGGLCMHGYEFTWVGSDLTGDCEVDLEDLALLLSNYGCSDCGPDDGDLNGDGQVNLSDLATLLAYYGETCFAD